MNILQFCSSQDRILSPQDVWWRFFWNPREIAISLVFSVLKNKDSNLRKLFAFYFVSLPSLGNHFLLDRINFCYCYHLISDLLKVHFPGKLFKFLFNRECWLKSFLLSFSLCSALSPLLPIDLVYSVSRIIFILFVILFMTVFFIYFPLSAGAKLLVQILSASQHFSLSNFLIMAWILLLLFFFFAVTFIIWMCFPMAK